ncbi:MAG TPA: D-alanyl-D-alanine carboxypeptidase family protein [Verrucomicrobiales bacterium]|nr:D-alanyl-D-alanine carboxypeptidase family protein [Verrucomicrobiales bacterium]
MMTNRRSFLRRASLLGLAAAPVPAMAQRLPKPPFIQAKACVVVDAVTGETLFEKNADERRPVASTQKLLSALVAVETTDMNKVTSVEEEETKVEPHKLFLKVDERLPLRTLLHAMLIESCNDCAHCMARSCAGTTSAFSQWMNRRAAQLGMRNSHFVNASGLPAEGQYSTARDMARLARVAFANATLRSIFGRSEIVITRGDGRTKKLQTTNILLRPKSSYYLPQCTGMKTGFTNASGKCLISSATLRGRSVICVMLGSTTSKGLIWKESRALLQWALGISTR